jgi:hypothetical protein
MERDISESEKLDKEISDLQAKIKAFKKGHESTIHDFAKGI